MSLKVTCWNIKNVGRLIDDAQPSNTIVDRRRRIRETIEEIDPDILCIVEGPAGEQGITNFCANMLDNQWIPVLMRQPGEALGDRDDDYQLKGSQWIWFVVKPHLLDRCRIQDPDVWQSFTGSKRWLVNYWGKIKPSRHSHYRHPQVMIMDIGHGAEIEMIGVHLKSKINRKRITRDENNNLDGEYLETALKARVKLATEAHNVRAYINAKFNQLTNPGILVMGDCNDGPGHDFFETQYLFFDLIQNLQGEVLVAERFFNHALFDFSGDLRWTSRFRDPIMNIPASRNPLLLDHILISQPLVSGELPLMVNAGNGLVEHQAFERANAGANSSTITSDHRPVTCVLDDNQV